MHKIEGFDHSRGGRIISCVCGWTHYEHYGYDTDGRLRAAMREHKADARRESFTVEVQFDIKADDAAAAWQSVATLLAANGDKTVALARVTAVFDEMGERVE